MSRLKSFLIRRSKSFKYAFNGLWFIFSTQVNFKIHLIAAIIAIGFGFWLKISNSEWLVLILTIFFVLIAEAINTIIEQIMDFVSPEFNKTVGLIKDLSAAAVLLTAIMAVIVGGIIFLPKLIRIIF